jgi:hypothetical protein
MGEVVLKSQTAQGIPLQATFFPEKGMNLLSYRRGSIEVIDQSTRGLFEERYAGLGALIGPHFHHRQAAVLPTIKDESLFPHIARVKAKGIQEPFSHGIARYAPWTAQVTENAIQGRLTGKDLWNGVALAALEGQNFTLEFKAKLTPEGLQIDYAVVSDTDSVVGLHYYYHLPEGRGKVIASVQNRVRKEGAVQPIPSTWNFDDQQVLRLDLNEGVDDSFFPFPHPCEGKIALETETYRLSVRYIAPSQENCWQLYHPAGASFVCIEPLSAKDPRHPNLTVSRLQVHLNIEDPKG